MAEAEQIATIRRMISEPVDEGDFTSAVLGLRIDNEVGGDLNKLAAVIWREKAAHYSELVDISEAGSSRRNSQLYANALAMAKSFDDAAAAGSNTAVSEYPTTRAIVRP